MLASVGVCEVFASKEATSAKRSCSGARLLTLQRVLGFRSYKKAARIDAELRVCGPEGLSAFGVRRLIGPYLFDMTVDDTLAALAVLRDFVAGYRQDCADKVAARAVVMHGVSFVCLLLAVRAVRA